MADTLDFLPQATICAFCSFFLYGLVLSAILRNWQALKFDTNYFDYGNKLFNLC